MKRPLQLPLAIALAMSGTDALALGLGTIHVNSKLNQPLDAEIPVIQGTAGEAEGLLVQLAAAEDFDRVGLNRSRLSVPLEFSLVKGASGNLVIKVTSKEIVREPFLDFLVEANWPKGRLLREYTVLLDPPVMAPASGTAVTSAAKTSERAKTQPLPESKPKAASKPAPASVAAVPRGAAPVRPAPATPAPKRQAGSGEYTVEAGDTLSGIARDVRPDESTNINQMMLALFQQNPEAFYKDNINALKRGAILRIPTADQIKAVGSAREAAAQVRAQIEDWRGAAAAKPTLVADTGATPAPEPKPSAKPASSSTSTASAGKKPVTGERLELVPPKAGKDSVAAADRPGSGSSASAGSASTTELKAELARAREALASREQEANELKSRVKDLEETKNKTDRLLSLKDSEIADLQRKLKELQEQQDKAASKSTASTTIATATPPAATKETPSTPATPAATAGKDTEKVSKEDIWGTASSTPEAKPSETTTASATPADTTPASAESTPSEATSTPAATPSATSDASPSTSAPATLSSDTSPSATQTPSPTATTTPAPVAATATPSPSTSTPASSPAKPTASTTAAVKPDAKTKIQPLPPRTTAWYEQSWVKPAAIGAGALLLLAALLGLRKRKSAVATERTSIAGEFGDSPIRDSAARATAASEEQALRDQLLHDPGNLGLHLELLSLLYAERNVDAFEDAAAAMHAYVTDPHQPEWLEARALGQELAPHNPLFADETARADAFDDEAVTAQHATMDAYDQEDAYERGEPSPSQASTDLAFDLDADVPSGQPAATPPSEAAFSFDNIPPLDFGKEARHEIEIAPPAPLPVDDDEFAAEDGVGTKLDLAKAYLDMGDPEGARSMLEEVLAEGNDTQKGEARRLMAEIK